MCVQTGDLEGWGYWKKMGGGGFVSRFILFSDMYSCVGGYGAHTHTTVATHRHVVTQIASVDSVYEELRYCVSVSL